MRSQFSPRATPGLEVTPRDPGGRAPAASFAGTTAPGDHLIVLAVASELLRSSKTETAGEAALKDFLAAETIVVIGAPKLHNSSTVPCRRLAAWLDRTILLRR